MQNRPTVAEVVVMASGGVALVFSFFDWLSYDTPFGHTGRNAWDSGLFPVFTWVAILGVVVAATVALERFAGVRFPERIAGFSWTQVHEVFAGYAALVIVSFLVVDKGGGASLGIGFIVSAGATAGLLAGSFLLDRERHDAAPPSSAPPGAF